MQFNSKRGSALLIVLGFLSFMIISAVAFSIYMRMERVPSSAFRRTVVTRNLLKGALAKAISRIDDSIGDDPFPGVVSPMNSIFDRPETGAAAQNLYRNNWIGRVFFPPNRNAVVRNNPTSNNNQYQVNGDDVFYIANPEDTVGVLTLEALGYLPPALINDVRFQSRRSWAASWDSLNFDAGKYAFCAVNVSDFFDVNKIKCDYRSSDPNKKISASGMFLNDNGDVDANQNSINSVLVTRPGDATSEYVSMLDYNLALPNSLFRQIVLNNRNNNIYGGNENSSSVWLQYYAQAFIAGSYDKYISSSSSTNKVLRSYDKDKVEQPFNWEATSSQMDGGESVQSIMTAGLNPEFYDNGNNDKVTLDLVNSTALYDYLDRDDIPTSLAMPTTERTPMVSAIGLEDALFQFQLGLVNPTPMKNTVQSPPAKDAGDLIEETKWELTGNFFAGGARISAVTVFPFKRGRDLNKPFKVQALARVFLAEAGLSARPGLPMVMNANNGQFKPTTENDWQPNPTYDPSQNNRWITLCSDIQTITPKMVNDKFGAIEQDTYDFTGGTRVDGAMLFNFNPPSASLSSTPLLVKREKTPYVNGVKDGQTETEWEVNGLVPVDRNFNPVFTNPIKNPSPPQGSFVPYVAVWVRILDNNGNVVDMVPATLADDKIWNNVDNASAVSALGADIYFNGQGNREPMLFFEGQFANGAFSYDSERLKQLGPAELAKNWGGGNKSLFVGDPRYNWAPENWFRSQNNASGPEWMNANNGLLGAGRDSDIFMFVSNQGYLQSMGEFGFIPRSGDLVATVSSVVGDMNGATLNGVIPNDIGSTAYSSFMWKTYNVYDLLDNRFDTRKNRTAISERRSGAYDLMFDCGIEDCIEGNFVNPYSDNLSILQSVIANTPYDWWIAGTNVQSSANVNSSDVNTKRKIQQSLNESLKYSLSPKSEEMYIQGEDMKKIAEFMREKFRTDILNNPNKTWQEIFDSWDWSGRFDENRDPFKAKSTKYPNGTNQDFYDSIHDVDRKYLYSFWRSCFRNQQQLFLVFVRAESSALGASGEDRSPGQLSGRAVALVWRDPEPPRTTIETEGDHTASEWKAARRPHQTRILFYHQFE